MSATTLAVAVATPLGVLLVALRLHAWVTTPPRRPVVSAGPTSGSSGWVRRPWRYLVRRDAAAPSDLEVAAWCERVAAGMRAGRSLTAAVADADATTPEHRPPPFPDVGHEVRRGRSIGAAFRAVDDAPSTATGLAAPVLATCAELGGPSARPIEAVADVLVARADEHAERLSASAQARLSARVMTVVPCAVAALLAVTEPSVRTAVTGPLGATCVLAGATLNAAGWWWMRSMIRAAT
jgi:Flp pilus assembly protein TadB